VPGWHGGSGARPLLRRQPGGSGGRTAVHAQAGARLTKASELLASEIRNTGVAVKSVTTATP
jgi:molybdenum-dependent DNA-binding transcriptional regulator ModE